MRMALLLIGVSETNCSVIIAWFRKQLACLVEVVLNLRADEKLLLLLLHVLQLCRGAAVRTESSDRSISKLLQLNKSAQLEPNARTNHQLVQGNR